MTMDNDPNLAILEVVAHALGPVRDDVVFVGGCAAGLLLTQVRADRIRATEDVDIVAQTVTLKDYQSIEQRVRARGFKNDIRADAPICRWIYGSIQVDLMPSEQHILGFANRWYPLVLETAAEMALPSGLRIRLITAPLFIATKLEAFRGRGRTADGKPDYLGSHDMEDIIAIVDRRPELVDECREVGPELREYLARSFSELVATADFMTTLAGHLPGDAASQGRLAKIIQILRELTRL